MINILKIRILNFRSFKQHYNVFSDISKINVISGKNNVGKTNILRAIYLFFNPKQYDYEVDRNYIKQITGGGSKESKLYLSFKDDKLIPNNEVEYTILCDINKEMKNVYSVAETSNEDVKKKLSTSQKINDYLNKNIKCVYLSTTDENISIQSEKIISDMILQYFSKKNKKINNAILEFKKKYDTLTESLKENICSIFISCWITDILNNMIH